MVTLAAFLLAIGLLVIVHEYGHYRVARACGVRVLRFSVGMGQAVWRWRSPHSGTEFVLGWLPLGGYVRMLDEREADVPTNQRHAAFNRQSVARRMAIVAAGPVANLLAAVVLFGAAGWIGSEQSDAVLSAPLPQSLAEQAGLRAGDHVEAVGSDEPKAIQSFEQLRWALMSSALDGQDVQLWVRRSETAPVTSVWLPLSRLDAAALEGELWTQIGILQPWSIPRIREVQPGGPAALAGLQAGDRVLGIDGQAVTDTQALRALIERAVDADGRVHASIWRIERQGQVLERQLEPVVIERAGQRVGRIAAWLGDPPATVWVRHEGLDALSHGVAKTLDMVHLSLRMIGRLFVGEASLNQVSGPLSIAEQAGRSAEQGVVAFLSFLGLVSVSLGIMNLLPIPVLDGGHLVYYLFEAISGKPLSDVWAQRWHRMGWLLVLLLMSVAVFNDVARLLG